jgi:uncharacterized protein
VSDLLRTELERALAYPKPRERAEASEAIEFIELLRGGADTHDDPGGLPSARSPDPGDDYLIALAESAQAMIVSGDRPLLGLAGQVPVFSPAHSLAELDSRPLIAAP